MYLKILFMIVFISNTIYAKSSWIPIFVSDIVVVIPNAQVNIPLSVSNIHPKNITKNSAKIFWDVSNYATGQVEYGETTAYGHFNTKETSFDYDSHGQALKNLKAGTTYHYRVISEDAAGHKIVSDDYTFTTIAIPITVSNIHPMLITENSAKIFWDVSSYATGQVEYGETTAYGYFNTKETSFNYNHHEQQLKDLQAGTTYHYRVISEDAEGHKIVSDDYTFATLGNEYSELGNYVPEVYSNNKEGDNKYIAYYPKNGIDADMPVVMFIKGAGMNIERYEGIMKFMASKGYYVIGVNTSSHQSAYVTRYLEIALNEAINEHGLNVSKLVIMGHSLGGGQVFYAMKKFRDDGYGSEGSLALSIDGWFAFNMNQVDLHDLDSKVAFLQMNGVDGTGTDPRIDLTIWNLSTQADKAFYTLPSNNHSYVAGDLNSILAKKDLLLTIGALTDDTFNGVDTGTESIPEQNKASYTDIYNALKAEDTYSGDCKGNIGNGISTIKNNDIDYCAFDSNTIKKYPETTLLEKRLTDETVVKPTIEEMSLDNIFNTQIKMVNKTGSAASPYPKIQAWNSDMTLIRIKFRLYNAMTLKESSITKGVVDGSDGTYGKLCKPLSSDFRWSTKDPNKFYVLNSSLQLIEGHIVGNSTNCETILFDFKKNNFEQAAIGPGEGNIDFNDKYIALPVKKKGDNKIYIFLYDLEKKKKVWDNPKLYNAEGAHWEADGKYWNPTVLDWVSVSPSGKYIVINDSNTGMYIYDINFKNKRRLEFYKDGQIKSEGGHGDIGFDTNNNEVFVQFISGRGVYSFNLDNPNEKGKELLNSPYGGGFVSCRNRLHKNWCYVTTREPGFQEIFALKLDGIHNNVVQRFTQTHGNYYGGVASPDGTKVLFSNKWGTDRLDTFVAEAQP